MITGLNHITLSVLELDRSFDFYTQLLDFQPLARWKKGAYLLAGDLWFTLYQGLAYERTVSAEYTHISFSVSAEDFALWQGRCESWGVRQWKQNTSEGDSIYILDPDGYKLELHVGHWQSRISATKADPYEAMEFFV
ncbi:MAG: VOC family protein [Cyanobacteria bacterium J06614_10]